MKRRFGIPLLILLPLFLCWGALNQVNAAVAANTFADIVTKGPWLDIRAFGASTSASASVNSSSIQAAINAAYTAGGGIVLVPPGVFSLVAATPLTFAGGTEYVCLQPKSNVWFVGPGTLKLADLQSSDVSPKNCNMFGSNASVSNVRWYNLTIDMNAANNRISPGRPSSYNRYHMAAIFFSGDNIAVSNMVVVGCLIKNISGVTAIGLGQSNLVGSTPLSSNITIRETEFYNVGTDTDDHSSLYLWAENVTVDNCSFHNDQYFGYGSTKVGGLVAAEIHGNNIKFLNNTIRNYFQGLWMASNLTRGVDTALILGNTMYVQGLGVAWYREGANDTAISGVTISKNYIELDNTYNGGVVIPVKAAVQIAPKYKTSNILIDGNIIKAQGKNLKAPPVALFVSAYTRGQEISDIRFINNLIIGVTAGVHATTNVAGEIGNLEVSNNTFKDLVDTVGSAAIGAYVAGTGTFKHFILKNNLFTDRQAVPTSKFGVYLTGRIVKLEADGNVFDGMTIADWTEAGSVSVTSRKGRDARGQK